MNLYLQNIEMVSEYASEVFMAEEIRESLVNNMVMSIYELNKKGASETYKVNNMIKDLNFDPSFIMSRIITMFVNFARYDEFKEQVIENTYYFNIEIFARAADLLSKHNVLDEKLI